MRKGNYRSSQAAVAVAQAVAGLQPPAHDPGPYPPDVVVGADQRPGLSAPSSAGRAIGRLLPPKLVTCVAFVCIPLLLPAASPVVPAHAQLPSPNVQVAYIHNGDLWLLDMKSGHRVHGPSACSGSNPRWITTGFALLYDCRSVGGASETWRWEPHGKGPTLLHSGLWSPDGTTVAFAVEKREPGLPSTVSVLRNGYTTKLNTFGSRFNWSPLAWSADSRRLALARFRIPPRIKAVRAVPGGSATLWVTVGPIAKHRLMQLPMPRERGGQPGWPDEALWSPNGRFLAVGVGPSQRCESCRADGRPFFAVPTAGGTSVELGTGLSIDESISWAPNGAYVVLSDGAGRETYANKKLTRIDLPSGKRMALTRSSRRADIEPAASPNGRQIIFARGIAADPYLSSTMTPLHAIASRHLFLMDANGSHARRLAGARSWTDEAPEWNRQDDRIVFVRWRASLHGNPAQAQLWAMRTNGQGAQRLATLDLPPQFEDGFGFYGSFAWNSLFSVTHSVGANAIAP